jgi:hypothetical protein
MTEQNQRLERNINEDLTLYEFEKRGMESPMYRNIHDNITNNLRQQFGSTIRNKLRQKLGLEPLSEMKLIQNCDITNLTLAKKQLKKQKLQLEQNVEQTPVITNSDQKIEKMPTKKTK